MKIKENISLRPFNTFGIDAAARYFSEAGSVADILNLLEDKRFSSLPRLVLGGGSNILFTKDFNGIVVKNSIRGIEKTSEDEKNHYVKAGAGEVWHAFVLYCIERNYGGLENLSLIPGCAGAAPIQNIGAYGAEQKDVFHELEAVDTSDNRIVTLKLPDCRFGYRDSLFKNQARNRYIITSVTYRLSKHHVLNTSYGAINQELERMGVKEISVASVSQAVCNIRRSKLPDPQKIGNAGSFFKNPVIGADKFNLLKKEFPAMVSYKDPGGMKLAAGWLIEQCGWKGRSFGNYGVHKDQALVLVNYGGAKGANLFELSEKIKVSVKGKFGIELEREVVVI